jgi:hypothetical protein
MSERLFPGANPKTLAAELLSACRLEMADDKGDSAHKAAYWLFQQVKAYAGLTAARAAFVHFGRPPTTRRRNEFKNYGLLDRLDMMKPKPVVLQLAKQLAKENALLPRSEQRGAGSTDVHALEKHIRDIVKKRETGLKKGTWTGPITDEQAVRHFGATNVETFSK